MPRYAPRRYSASGLAQASGSATDVDQVVIGLQPVLNKELAFENANHFEFAAGRHLHGLFARMPLAQPVNELTIRGRDIELICHARWANGSGRAPRHHLMNRPSRLHYRNARYGTAAYRDMVSMGNLEIVSAEQSRRELDVSHADIHVTIEVEVEVRFLDGAEVQPEEIRTWRRDNVRHGPVTHAVQNAAREAWRSDGVIRSSFRQEIQAPRDIRVWFSKHHVGSLHGVEQSPTMTTGVNANSTTAGRHASIERRSDVIAKGIRASNGISIYKLVAWDQSVPSPGDRTRPEPSRRGRPPQTGLNARQKRILAGGRRRSRRR